jgi:hypothetical protein
MRTIFPSTGRTLRTQAITGSRREGEAISVHDVDPNSWKDVLFPDSVRLWKRWGVSSWLRLRAGTAQRRRSRKRSGVSCRGQGQMQTRPADRIRDRGGVPSRPPRPSGRP